MKYRAEVDGLRAVAILPVIFFHAGFKAFEGGFVGVDVFFVVSGYLITTIILSDMNNNKFSIVTFYERRARRIMPALFFVMLCCLPFAYMWLLPLHLKDFSQSLTAVSAFSSNILFWRESGYFGVASELKPLLHTWSLAVEEQYYVLFPLFLMLLWKLRKRWIFGTLMVVGAMSLAVAQYAAYNHPSANFFLLPTRAWELAIGALIAFYFLYKREHAELIKRYKKTSEVFGAVGLLMICYSVFAFSNSTPFPSLYALIPTVGTGLVIVFATSETAVGKLLSTKFMVGVGLISYSTYLWHQPLFVFARHRSLEEPSTVLLLVLSAASLLLAYISWRYVESPFRNKKAVSRKAIFTFTLVGSIAFAGIGLAGHFSDGFMLRLSKQDIEILNLPKKHVELRDDGGCNLNKSQIDLPGCEYGASTVPTIALVGDSHAQSLLFELTTAAENKSKRLIQYTKNDCALAFGLNNINDNRCYDFVEKVINNISKSDTIKHVIIAYRFSYYISEPPYENGVGGVETHDNRHTIEGISLNSPNSIRKTAILNSYVRTLKDFALRNPNKTFYLLTPMPEHAWNVPETIVKYSFYDKNITNLPKFVYDTRHADVYNILVKFEDIPNLKIIDVTKKLCDKDSCFAIKDGKPLYYDDDHLSHYGASLIVGGLNEVFE